MAALEMDALGKIEVLDEVGSTNDELMARARAGAPHGAALRARSQVAGKGRRTHQWSSPTGGLYMSVLVVPEVPDRLLPGLPVACGIGVAHTLYHLGCKSVRLKWPNDIVVDEGKLGGILVEVSRSSGRTVAVCGLGINYRTPRIEHPTDGSLPVVGLMRCLPDGAMLPEIDELAECLREGILVSVEEWTERALAAGSDALPLTGLIDTYHQFLAYIEQPVVVFSPEGSMYEIHESGILRGVDGWGRARVETEPGKIEYFDASQVSIRLKQDAGEQ
ncbi:biotin--[acetyl-CoA-carboxylase] ligase [Collinsella sp. An2]|uniref:biotin--[acetyl-CoA-carboxylase] ligase n=1 Tax=Collinsella sp. An2 TaxID=1965585 RepID=UPI000B387639|nr:biotin--[acetyl-CoA-carboxylase] ligase [Collinsella sp. An2]OUP09181.1 biotin--[acetyl-CoA-carboxylase] ligase [Collinsella sp. An2]